MSKVVAVVSGGLDSVSFMGYYLNEGHNVEAITYDYGQKATQETEALRTICKRLEIPLKVIDIRFMKELWKGTQLTDDTVEVKKEYEPSVVVPLRNGVMLMVAFSYAYSIGAQYVIYGSHIGDIGKFDHEECGSKEYFYPDCSPEFATSLKCACEEGVFKCDNRVQVDSPAIRGWDKASLIRRGIESMGELIFQTWSCYSNGTFHCGKCESCINRQNAFHNAKVRDETQYGSKV